MKVGQCLTGGKISIVGCGHTHMMRVGTEIVHLSRGKLSLGEENMAR